MTIPTQFIPVIKPQFFDDDGVVLALGKIGTYIAGTSTQTATYSDRDGNTANTNPVVLDASGRADIFLDSSIRYKFIVMDADDVPLYTVDDVYMDAGDIEYDPVVTYAAGSVGAAIDALENQDAYDIPFTQVGSGAVERNVGVKLNESISVKDFGAVGDGSTDDTAAIQAAIDAAVNGEVFFPSGTYKITSTLYRKAPTYAAGDVVYLRGEGSYASVISVVGDITGFACYGDTGTVGGMSNIGMISATNTYNGGGGVTFSAPNSIGVLLRDSFQFAIVNCTFEQFGIGVKINNYTTFSEGTYMSNTWCRNNSIGLYFKVDSGTDSFSHTQLEDMKIQIAKDSATDIWCTGVLVEGNFASGGSPAQIYNSRFHCNFWTGDNVGDSAFMGNFVRFKDHGRISDSFIQWTFERYGKITIEEGGYIDGACHTFLAAPSAAQVIFDDQNTDLNLKYRSTYKGNINKNLAGYIISDWQGSGVTNTMAQGDYYSTALGYHYGTGAGIGSPTIISLDGARNGLFYGTTPDAESNVTFRFCVDGFGSVFPNATTGASLQQGAGVPSVKPAGTLYLNNTSDRTVDLTPVWAAADANTILPLQVIRASTGRPSAPTDGMMLFDNNTGKPIWWKASTSKWVFADGAVAY